MKNIIINIILFFSIVSCGKKTENENMAESNKDEQIEIFWDWFVKNEKRFSKIETNKDEVLKEILDNSSSIESALAFEIKSNKNGILSLTISADGVKNLIQIVQNIKEKSPKIKGWKFIAFRQRKDAALLAEIFYESKKLRLNLTKMKFFPIIENDRLELIIYTSGINKRNYQQIFYGGSVLLDNLVGEYSFMTKVDNYDFHNMPTKAEELNELKPLLELPSFIDNFKPKKDKKCYLPAATID